MFTLACRILVAIALAAAIAGQQGGAGCGSGGANGRGTSDASLTAVCTLCAESDCPPPRPGAPNFLCPDGGMSGPACVRTPDGSCSWAMRSCDGGCGGF